MSTSRDPKPTTWSTLHSCMSGLPRSPVAPRTRTLIVCDLPASIYVNNLVAHWLEHLLPQQLEQIRTISAVPHGCSNPLHLLCSDVAGSIRDLLRASHHQSLSLLNGLNVKSGVHQRFVRSGIQPRHAPSHHHDLQLSLGEVRFIHVRDFQFSACAGLERPCDRYYLTR